MEQTTPTTKPEMTTAPASENPPKLTLEVIIAGMMQTRRDIEAYRNGKMSQEEFDALGIKFY